MALLEVTYNPANGLAFCCQLWGNKQAAETVQIMLLIHNSSGCTMHAKHVLLYSQTSCQADHPSVYAICMHAGQTAYLCCSFFLSTTRSVIC